MNNNLSSRDSLEGSLGGSLVTGLESSLYLWDILDLGSCSFAKGLNLEKTNPTAGGGERDH